MFRSDTIPKSKKERERERQRERIKTSHSNKEVLGVYTRMCLGVNELA